jgi:heme/copper-type cytochrome/quinol oxidase subunit 2
MARATGERRGRRRAGGRLALSVALAVAGGTAPAAEDSLSVTASRDGFRPATLKLRKGETVRLRLASADGEHCFAVDALRVEKRITPGRTTILDLTPTQAGSFRFHCCLESGAAADRESGRLVVSE